MFISRHRLSNAGDTIIEVMVVLAILGLAIGISYSTASRSLLETRGAQENSYATELVQAQLEYVRSLATSNPPAVFSSPNNKFCVIGGTTYNFAPVNVYPAQCIINSIYSLSVTYDNSDDTFTGVASWADLQQGAPDSVTLVYRVHP